MFTKRCGPILFMFFLFAVCFPVRAEVFELRASDFPVAPVSASLVGDFNNWATDAGPMRPAPAGFRLDVSLAESRFSRIGMAYCCTCRAC